MRSHDFEQGGIFPDVYTCKGANISPPLVWSNVPAGTQSFALEMTDQTARAFVHWKVTSIPGSTRSIAAGATFGGGAHVEKNSFGKAAYGGPCPPNGVHRYLIRITALSGGGSSGQELDNGFIFAFYGRK